MRKVKLIFLAAILGIGACQHEPFPPRPGSDGKPDKPNSGDTTSSDDPQNACDPDSIYFHRDIQPILTSNCAYSGCHGQGSSQDGVSLEDYAAVMNSNVVDPGDLSGSDLYENITETDPDKIMPPPPNSSLTAEEIALIRRWIMQGAQNLRCEACDTNQLTYTNAIQGLIKANCESCHSGSNPSGGRWLDSYNDLQTAVNGTQLLQRINRENGVPPMPPGGPLNDCDLQKIEAWVQDGMPQ